MSSAAGTRRGSPRIRVMPAASMATSVPPPMAMPMSAAARAGASLMPSPTIATTPVFFSSATVAALSAGSTSAWTSLMPSASATTLALPRLSPVSRWLLMLRALSCCTACSAPALRVSPKARGPALSVRGFARSARTGSGLRFPRRCADPPMEPALNPLSSSRRRLPSASDDPRACRQCRARQRLAVTDIGHGQTAFGASIQHGLGQRMFTAALQGAGHLQQGGFVTVVAVKWAMRGAPEVSVPVLSKTTALTSCARSSASASLISIPYAPPHRCRP